MCTNINERAVIEGSGKGPSGWMRVDTANVSFDHPYHAPYDHTLNIDFTNESDGGRERIALELSATSARLLCAKIMAALEQGEAQHI